MAILTCCIFQNNSSTFTLFLNTAFFIRRSDFIIITIFTSRIWLEFLPRFTYCLFTTYFTICCNFKLFTILTLPLIIYILPAATIWFDAWSLVRGRNFIFLAVYTIGLFANFLSGSTHSLNTFIQFPNLIGITINAFAIKIQLLSWSTHLPYTGLFIRRGNFILPTWLTCCIW